MAGYYSGTIQKGSKGDETKKWQEFLNTQGYSLSVDGDFGDLTDQATRDYQQKNGLTVDGIVGQNTWGKAGFKNVNTPVSAPTLGAAPTAPTFDTTSWLDTDKGKEADKTRQDANDAVKNYGDFSYSNDAMYKDIIDKILNREKFSYDLNGDALYQQYKDKYIQQGKMAMQDTMGQAAAMTGGYGNSYAASVGNQAYQAQLNNLNDVIPELYQLAYDKYNQEGQDLYNQYSMLSDDKNTEYGMWGDKYNKLVDQRNYADSDFYNQADLYYNDQTNANNIAQQGWQNEFNTWTENTDNAQWEASWAEGQRRDQRDFDEAVRQANATVAAKKVVDDDGGVKDDGGGGNDDDKPKYTYQETDATKMFKASIKTKNEFYSRGGSDKATYGTYEKYIEGIMDKWLKNGQLTENDVATLLQYYGL